jgi:hypothetical protein
MLISFFPISTPSEAVSTTKPVIPLVGETFMSVLARTKNHEAADDRWT